MYVSDCCKSKIIRIKSEEGDSIYREVCGCCEEPCYSTKLLEEINIEDTYRKIDLKDYEDKLDIGKLENILLALQDKQNEIIDHINSH